MLATDGAVEHVPPIQIDPVRPVKAVLFDFDGTLWDPEPHIFQCYQAAFREYRCTLPISLWASMIGTVNIDLWGYLEEISGIAVDRVGAEEGVRRQAAALLAAVTHRPGIRDVLDAVDAAGLVRGIVSNSDRSWISRYAAQCGVDGGWVTIRSADGDRELAKPSPYLYQRALADVGVDAAEALAFEDSLTGIKAATAAGIRCVAVPNQMMADLDRGAAHLLVDSFEEVDMDRLLGHPASLTDRERDDRGPTAGQP